MIRKEHILLLAGVLLIIYTILTPAYVVCIQPGPECNTNSYNPFTFISGIILIMAYMVLFFKK